MIRDYTIQIEVIKKLKIQQNPKEYNNDSLYKYILF
jgi:hypothetical protein